MTPRPLPFRHTLPAACVALLCAALSGCVVTSKTTRPSTTFSSRSSQSPRPAPSTSAPATTEVPGGPIATPISPTRSSRLSTSFMELGTVPYDGQVLPLTSPDGRFIAVEVGTAPTWPTLLATPGAEVPANTTVQAYSLPDPAKPAATDKPAPSVATRITWQHPLPGGLILGRSCDSAGFLVESPQADGSRWIGRIDWLSGSLRWLVQGGEVNSYATLGPGGELVFSNRPVADNPSPPALVINAWRNQPLRLSTPDVGYVFPFFADEPDIVYSFALSQAGMEVVAVKIPQASEAQVLTIVGRQTIARSLDIALLYQATATLQTPFPSLTRTSGDLEKAGGTGAFFAKALYFHPEQGRVMLFDRRALRPTLFPRGSIGAAPVFFGGGKTTQFFLVAAPRRGLEYVEIETKTDFDNENIAAIDRTEGIRIVNEPFLPRLTTDPAWPYLLVGPNQSGESQSLRLRRLRLRPE